MLVGPPGGGPEAASATGTFAGVGGLFVTFEGIDRSGKTTQARMLCDALGSRCVGVRDPGGTAVGEELRRLLKDPAVELDAHAEALLFAAARAESVSEVIRPALASGLVVVSDRYVDSSLAYQGDARGLGVDEVARINEWATGGLRPDLTFLLTLRPTEAAARGIEDDRFENEGPGFQVRVNAAYERMADADPHRWHRLHADRPPDVIHAEVLESVEHALARVPA
jgi:dTMP kinase